MSTSSPTRVNRRILIIDDNEAIHDDFKKVLTRKNEHEELEQLEESLFGLKPSLSTISYELDSAFQGQEGLRLVKEAHQEGRPYALAFVDMKMPPGWDGMETIQRLWEVDSDIQIVICTAYSDYTWEDIHHKFGDTDQLLILKKPFDIAEVLQMACALTEKWALSKMRRNFQMISRTTSAMTGEDFVQSLVMNLSHGFGAAVACVVRFEQAHPVDQIVMSYATQRDYQDHHQDPLGPSVFSKLANRKASLFIQNKAQSLYPHDKFLKDHDIHSLLALPLEGKNGETIGALGLMYSEPTLEEQYDYNTLKILATRAQAELSRQIAEAELRKSEERYKLAMMGANDGLWDWDLQTGQLFLSPRFHEMLGYKEGELGQTKDDLYSMIHPDDLDILIREIDLHQMGSTPHLYFETKMKRKDHAWLWVLIRGLVVKNESGKAIRMAGSMTDIDSRKKTEQDLLNRTFNDSLTKLPNRDLFMIQLSQAMDAFKWDGNNKFAVLYLDMDRFKVLNDSLGHQTGDQILVQIAKRLKDCVRPMDTLTRLGADEFAVLVHGVQDIQDATSLAGKIQEQITEPFEIEGQQVYLTISIGVSFSLPRYEHGKELLRDADLAMSRAKLHGKGTVEVFDSAMHSQAQGLMRMETDLRQAVKRDQFDLFYQPIVCLNTLNMVGFEALLRWRQNPETIVSPDTFIRLAEETGLIHDIGRQAIFSACKMLRKWRDTYPEAESIVMNVNLSPIQFRRESLAIEISEILDLTKLKPKDLRLEITESLIMENTDRVQRLINELSEMGFSLSMDDFGTGYSSLSYLHRLPIDLIKIDRSFISNMLTDPKKLGIVRVIVGLAQSLGVKLTAEGVETAEQLVALQGYSCQYAQGFYFAKPLESNGAEKLIQGPQPWRFPHEE